MPDRPIYGYPYLVQTEMDMHDGAVSLDIMIDQGLLQGFITADDQKQWVIDLVDQIAVSGSLMSAFMQQLLKKDHADFYECSIRADFEWDRRLKQFMSDACTVRVTYRA